VKPRRGFALLTVLWAIVVLSAIAGAALLNTGLAVRAIGNRIELTRAEWARTACWAVVRDVMTVRELIVDSLAVGAGSWCTSSVVDLGARINVNSAPPGLVACVIGTGVPVRRARPRLANDRVLQALLTTARQEERMEFLTTRGDGVVSLNSASREVLECIPGLGREGARSIVRRRTLGDSVTSIDALLSQLSPSQRALFHEQAQESMPVLAAGSSSLVVTVNGHAGSRGTRASMRIELQRNGNGFLVTRREVE